MTDDSIPANAVGRVFPFRPDAIRLAVNYYITDLRDARKRVAASMEVGSPFEFIVSYQREGAISPAIADLPPKFLAEKNAHHDHGMELPPRWPYDVALITSRSGHEETVTTIFVEELEYERTRVAVLYQGSYPWGLPGYLFRQIEKNLQELGLS